VKKAISETLDGLTNARNFGDVDSGAEDHKGIVKGVLTHRCVSSGAKSAPQDDKVVRREGRRGRGVGR
jgi:hypothetical protein